MKEQIKIEDLFKAMSIRRTIAMYTDGVHSKELLFHFPTQKYYVSIDGEIIQTFKSEDNTDALNAYNYAKIDTFKDYRIDEITEHIKLSTSNLEIIEATSKNDRDFEAIKIGYLAAIKKTFTTLIKNGYLSCTGVEEYIRNEIQNS